jgi:serine/threonine protein kinase
LRQAGDIVERFELLGLLGEGGLATVHLARHLQLGTQHAIKFLSAPSPQMTERLLREGRIQARLRHPNVVSVTDVVQSDGEVGLVMEFVQGFSLSDCIRDGGAMELQEALVLFSQILGGVGTAHAAGILHRDIKPANVLLTSQGDTVIAKVADFGIAKFGKRSAGTLGGTPMGTPGYMAPEQVSDSTTVTRRADIFALGALLYELLGGKPAFPGTDLRGILNATATGAFTPLSVHAPATPRRVIEAVERALDPDAEARFDSVEGFAHALGIPVNIVPPSEGVEFVPPGEAPPVRLATMIPVVELAPDEEDTFGRQEMPPPVSSQRPSRPPMTRAPPSLFDLNPTPGSPRRARVTSPPTPSFEDVRDSMSVEERYGLDDPSIEVPGRKIPSLPKVTQDTRQPGQDEPQGAASEQDSDDVVKDFVWPMLTVLGNTARYLAVPLLLVVGIGYLGGLKGQEAVRGASRSYETAEDQLAQAVLSQREMATQLAVLGTRGPSLKAMVKATERGDPQARVAASKQLSDAMLDELRMLPPNTDPAEELKRRSLELQIQDLGRAHERRAEALGQWQHASDGVTGGMAIRLGMAPAPPKIER